MLEHKLRELPSVDDVIAQYKHLMISAPYLLYVKKIRDVLKDVRKGIQNGEEIKNIKKHIFEIIESDFINISNSNIKNVINGTGIILHTGLGRAPISDEVIKNAMKKISPYTNIELELKSGKRGERNNHIINLISIMTGTESALVVNNNASAVLLMLNTMAEGKEVIISRGEQVEIGGSFRIPDVIVKSGCKMIEVGTTNKTHLKDYENAINEHTGAIMVAHTSNYKVMGFTHAVALSELGKLASKKRIPLLVDLGCGALADFKQINLPDEPNVLSYVKAANGIFTFSGDKLLGGPQAGIICGKKSFINKIHQNPLYRAMRCDKIIFSILEEVLRTYLKSDNIHENNLTIKLFKRKKIELEKIANALIEKLPSKIIQKYNLCIKETAVEAGSGSLPLEKLPSIAIVVRSGMKMNDVSKKFRMASTPILGYIKENKFHIDLKAIPDYQEELLLKSIREVLK